ncbi:Insulinase (Peptidase M16) [Actinomortierella wolfii]|nr:Insulinase (Peptidase M16) [Actinomortierella wolfii]
MSGEQATNRMAKKAKLSASSATVKTTLPIPAATEEVEVLSHKARRKALKAARPPKEKKKKAITQKPKKDTPATSKRVEHDDGEDEDEDNEELPQQHNGVESDDDDDVSENDLPAQAPQSRKRAREEDDDSEEEETESIGPVRRGGKGYRPKVKKPSGKKGKVFVDNSAMLSILDQVADKEEARIHNKQENMAKLMTKISEKEKQKTEKQKARKALIDKKIEELKKKKSQKRKENKQKAAEQEMKQISSIRHLSNGNHRHSATRLNRLRLSNPSSPASLVLKALPVALLTTSSRSPATTASSMASSSDFQTPPATLPDGYVLASSRKYADFTKPIEKSLNDDRDYRLLRLNNELEVLLIHDPNVDKSAAALDVHVGHLSDPKNLQGLAHFLEHLLFMGTAKYPRENEYSEYLAQHAGMSNAFTNLDNTNYYFEVGHEYLEGALDRFAQFFISPAFSENCKDRELRAVDSEHKKNLQSDTWRLFQLGKNMSSPHHPYHQFGTGNLETLQDNPAKEGIDVRDELIKFHSKYYSANIMKLVILGREPLDQLAAWAVEKFSPIRNLGIKPPAYTNPPWTEKELLNVAYVKPVKDVRSLQIQFPFPDQYPHYKVHPARYLTHTIGHESKGSILSLLKKKGWANGLSAGTSQGGIGFEFFKITVDLTKEGLAHYEDVTVTIFQYLEMLRREGVRPYIWNELAQLAEISFRFKEKSQAAGYVSRLAGVMQRGYAPEWVLSGSYLIRESNPQLVMECLDCLRRDNWRAMLVAQDTSVVPGGAFTQREHYYGTEYHVEPVTASLMKRLENLALDPELHLPAPNDYIPTNFEVGKVPIVKPLTSPILIRHSPLTRIWHKKDDTFWVPKATLVFQLRTPLAYSSPRNNVKTHLYVELLRDALNEYSYDAEMAGLAYNLETNVDGMVLSIDGYNDKAHVLLSKVVEKMKTLEIKPERFHLLQEQLARTYKNFKHEAPYQHAMYYMSYLTQEKLWTHDEKLAELQEMGPKDIEDFYPELLSRLHIEGLIHGNMLAADALKAAAIVEEGLSPKALLPSQLIPLRAHLLPANCNAVYSRMVADPNNVNSGIEYFIQTGDAADTAMRAKVQVLAQIVNEPCFNQLRTKEQLGYLVFSGVRRQSGAIGLRFILQSERDPVHLESRIDAFLEERLKPFLEEMTEQEYQKQVSSLIQKKLEKDKNLRVETHRYWGHITSGYYEFDEIASDVAEMRKLTKDEILAFAVECVLPSGAKTRKLSVHLESQKVPQVKKPEGKETEEGEAPAKLREGTVVIQDLVGYKAGLELSRAPYPVVDLLKYTSPHL